MTRKNSADTAERSVALKIDVDTFRGMRQGIPRLLDILTSVGVAASFYLTFGPDNSGRAICRITRKKGFLGKMLRTNAVKMYGGATLLYGTFLPAPRICPAALAPLVREIEEQGHEVGIHAWDHVRWQDRLASLSPQAIRGELTRAWRGYEDLLHHPPLGFAAPAWCITPQALSILGQIGFRYTSISRGRYPFYPALPTSARLPLEIPTTLPTLDELLGHDGVNQNNFNDVLLARCTSGLHVYTLHAETEGLAFAGLFADLLKRMQEARVRFVRLDEVARQWLSLPPTVVKTEPMALGSVYGRAGLVAIQKPME